VALAFINDSFTVNASGGTTTGTRPTSVGSGNLLYAKWDIYDVDATTGTSLPTGWTLITKNYVTNASGAVTQILAWADGAATLAFVGPSNYTNLYLAGYSGQNASARSTQAPARRRSTRVARRRGRAPASQSRTTARCLSTLRPGMAPTSRVGPAERRVR
jgi:hypothetical protein